MAGVRLTPHARAKLKLLVDLYRGHYPNDEVHRDTVIDWAIADLQPLDWNVVWNGKNYALECRACGFVAVRAPTALRHLRRGCEPTDSTLDMAARPGDREGRSGALSVHGLGPASVESTPDIDERVEQRLRLIPGEVLSVCIDDLASTGNA